MKRFPTRPPYFVKPTPSTDHFRALTMFSPKNSLTDDYPRPFLVPTTTAIHLYSIPSDDEYQCLPIPYWRRSDPRSSFHTSPSPKTTTAMQVPISLTDNDQGDESRPVLSSTHEDDTNPLFSFWWRQSLSKFCLPDDANEDQRPSLPDDD